MKQEDSSFLSLLVKFLGLFTTIGGLITQFILNDQIKIFFQINSSEGGKYLNAFSFGGIIIGVTIIVILYKYRFVLSNKIYFNRVSGINYLNKITNPGRESNSLSIEETKEVSEKKIENLTEPIYFTFQAVAILGLILDICLFIGIFYLNSDLSKATVYFIFILLLVFTLTIFLLDLYNTEQRKFIEEHSLNYISLKIEKLFLPEIKYKGGLKIYEPYPSRRYLDFVVEGKKYRAVVNLFDPDSYFEIFIIDDNSIPNAIN